MNILGNPINAGKALFNKGIPLAARIFFAIVGLILWAGVFYEASKRI